jgi:signal transduction histidine kinase
MKRVNPLDTFRRIIAILGKVRQCDALETALNEAVSLFMEVTEFSAVHVVVESATDNAELTFTFAQGAAIPLCFEQLTAAPGFCGSILIDDPSDRAIGKGGECQLLPTSCGCRHIGYRWGLGKGVPIGVAGRGMLLALSESLIAPSPEAVSLTGLFCQLIGETVDRLGEADRADKRAADLATVNAIGRLITARLTIKEMVKEIVAQLGHVFETDEVNVVTYDNDAQELTFLARYFGVGSAAKGPEVRPLSDGINSWIVKNRTPLLMKFDTEVECTQRGIRHGGRPAKSWLGAPMIYQDRVVGVLSVQSYDKTGLYDDYSEELLTTVASQCAVAVENAKLFEELVKREEEREKLYFSLTHDLLSLLNPVSGFAKLLRSLPDGTEQIRYEQLADSMIQSAESITRFVEDVLVWGKIRAGQLTLNIARSDVGAVAAVATRAYFPEVMMRKVAVSINGELVDTTQPIPLVQPAFADFDVAQIERVFLNLIGNAAKHARTRIDISIEIKGGAVRCRIVDDGDGVPANQLQSVFEEFYQAGAKRKGVGLGLPTVKKIVELHHGAIMVDSAVGEGFSVDFGWPRTLADRKL